MEDFKEVILQLKHKFDVSEKENTGVWHKVSYCWIVKAVGCKLRDHGNTQCLPGKVLPKAVEEKSEKDKESHNSAGFKQGEGHEESNDDGEGNGGEGNGEDGKPLISSTVCTWKKQLEKKEAHQIADATGKKRGPKPSRSCVNETADPPTTLANVSTAASATTLENVDESTLTTANPPTTSANVDGPTRTADPPTISANVDGSTHTADPPTMAAHASFVATDCMTKQFYAVHLYLSDQWTSDLQLDTELAKEIAAGRILGPFSERPLTNLRTSGMGAVPKKNGKWRVIMHLSAPEGSSINDFIDKEDFPIHYATVDDAVAMVSRYGKGCMMAKIDLKAAFRMVPIAAEEWDLLGLHWKRKYYVDTCLPFGLRSAPYLFNQFASALHWIMATNYAADVIHYLDDFLLAGPAGQPTCSESAETMLRLRLPPDKLQEMTILIKSWLGKHKATKRDLLSLIGKLSFAAIVVPSGRLFLLRLIELSTTVSKLHHHIHLNVEAREDIIWWDRFLPSWNGVLIFLDSNWKDAETINLFTDASGTLGYGAYFNGAWFRGDWSPHQGLPLRSIQWQELFAIVAPACTWGHLLQGQRITVHCDNMAIVQAWSNQCQAPRNSTPPADTVLHHCQAQFYCQPTANTSTSRAGRTLSHQMEKLLRRALAPSTFNTNQTGIKRYYDFCSTHYRKPLPGTTRTLALFVTDLSLTLQPRTIQVYISAVSYLHHVNSLESPTTNNPVIKLLVQGVERSMPAAHLKPKRQPITNKDRCCHSWIGSTEQLTIA
eukprot:Em0001g796a